MSLIIGQLLELVTTFTKEPSGGPTFDPGTVVFKIRKPSGSISNLELPLRLSPGKYQVQIPLNEAGTWWFRAEGHDESGLPVAADEGPFEVRPSHF